MSISLISSIVQFRIPAVVVSSGTGNKLWAITLLTEDKSEFESLLTLV